MRNLWMAAGMLLVAAPLAAQDSEPPAGVLRQRIEERFAARVREELGLDDEQATRLRETTGTYFSQRRALEREEVQLRIALARQLRPGIAANRDSVSRVTERLADLKVRYAETYRDELRDLSGFLDPVQRAQFFMLRERLLERARQLREERSPLRRRQ